MAQGTLDGFCGIYAAVHLIGELAAGDYEDSTEKAFFQILKSLERGHKLTAKRIASTNGDEIGFTGKIIANAINDIPTRSAFGLAAISFHSSTFKSSKYRKNAKLAFEDGCGFVIAVDQKNHWVATRSVAKRKGYKCFDPWPDGEHKTFGKIFWDQGVMIGPRSLIQDI